jgi:hypothetical protein
VAVEFNTRLDCYFEFYFPFTAFCDTATAQGARKGRTLFLVVVVNCKEGDRGGYQ